MIRSFIHSFRQNRSSPVQTLISGPYAAAPMQPPPQILHPHTTQPPPSELKVPAHFSSNKFARLASCASTLVTPTPKKAKLSHNSDTNNADTYTNTGTAININNTSSEEQSTDVAAAVNYSRKKKSLGILAENFLNSYQRLPKGSTVVVDEAAIKLGVERRRIYDVVNILESISLVCKKHKNTYTWMGMEHLDAVFARLQAQAISEYPADAKRFLGKPSAIAEKNGNRKPPPLPVIPLKPARKQSKSRENKSLAKLSQEFLQVFLVGHETLSLPEASDKIQGTTSMEELIAMGCSSHNNSKEASTEKELKAAAARGLKTKIRRLYDIANVFLSVGLLKKVDRGDASRRPNFSWSYRISAKDLYELSNAQLQQQHKPQWSTEEEVEVDETAVLPAAATTSTA